MMAPVRAVAAFMATLDAARLDGVFPRRSRAGARASASMQRV
jgi:hypothetical protein